MIILFKFFRRTEAASLYLNIFFLLTLAGCSSSKIDRRDPDSLISVNNIKANLSFLASDELEGREAATRSEKIAALFIASELKKYGVKPLYSDYLQAYELASTKTDSFSIVQLISKNDTITLNNFENFIPGRKNSKSTEGKYKLVFAGYGISAPEFNYNDYAGLDVKGKIVIVAPNAPAAFDSLFSIGESATNYSDREIKISIAQKLGAAGIIEMPPDFFLKNWDRFAAFSKGESISLNNENERLLNLVFDEESLQILFNNEKYSFTDIKNLSDNSEPLPDFELSKEIYVSVKINSEKNKSYNVVGLIEGNDPEKKDEYIAIGAHYDHLGIRNGEVYNGADDNASGTSALLEIARIFSETRMNERSILIVFHGAEEKGLLGSDYFTSNFDKINNIIAHINLDMVGRGHIDTIYSVGSGKLSSEFKNFVEQVNEETTGFKFNYRFDDPSDRHRIYYRSDHYHYAKYNIPIVFFYDFMTEDYHKGSDEIDKINFEKIRKTALLVYNIALRAANYNGRFTLDNAAQ